MHCRFFSSAFLLFYVNAAPPPPDGFQFNGLSYASMKQRIGIESVQYHDQGTTYITFNISTFAKGNPKRYLFQTIETDQVPLLLLNRYIERSPRNRHYFEAYINNDGKLVISQLNNVQHLYVTSINPITDGLVHFVTVRRRNNAVQIGVDTIDVQRGTWGASDNGYGIFVNSNLIWGMSYAEHQRYNETVTEAGNTLGPGFVGWVSDIDINGGPKVPVDRCVNCHLC